MEQCFGLDRSKDRSNLININLALISNNVRYLQASYPQTTIARGHSNHMGQISHRHRRERASRQDSGPTQYAGRCLLLWELTLTNASPTHTPRGIRTRSRTLRKAARNVASYGTGADWGRQALSAYTWVRTDKGPLATWLHHIGKATSPQCKCGHPLQDGTHVTFHCPLLQEDRTHLLRSRNTWLSLDEKLYIQDNPDDEAYEATEQFFYSVFDFLTG